MDGSLLLWMTLALLVFWSVGVYNRLMRMRARGLGALGSVMKHMGVYADLLRSHAPQPAAHTLTNEWQQLLASLQTLEQMLKEATASALMQGSPGTLGQAFDAVHAAWRRAFDGVKDVVGTPEWAATPALRDQLEYAALRVGTAREGFNQLLTKYNQALEQFPASLVVSTMGFKPGNLL